MSDASGFPLLPVEAPALFVGDLDLGATPLSPPQLDGVIAQGDDDGPCCPICGAELERVDCDACGGEGGRDSDQLMSDDPLWYDGIDWEDCADCGGQGHHWECPNAPHEKEP